MIRLLIVATVLAADCASSLAGWWAAQEECRPLRENSIRVEIVEVDGAVVYQCRRVGT